jgi:hypothetical protein
MIREELPVDGRLPEKWPALHAVPDDDYVGEPFACVWRVGLPARTFCTRVEINDMLGAVARVRIDARVTAIAGDGYQFVFAQEDLVESYAPCLCAQRAITRTTIRFRA